MGRSRGAVKLTIFLTTLSMRLSILLQQHLSFRERLVVNDLQLWKMT